MSMLSKGDIEFMKGSVREVINEWQTTILIMQPLPIDQQPNYNKILHEYTGDVAFETISISAERKDIVNNYTNSLPVDDTEYGIKNAGTLLYAIPNILPVFSNGRQVGVKQFKPHKEAIIAVDDSGDRYYITSIRDRIGETLITIKRYVGDKPDGVGLTDTMPIDGLADPDTIVTGSGTVDLISDELIVEYIDENNELKLSSKEEIVIHGTEIIM